MNIDDTIVAISSPPGAAQRGIVRLSGPSALDVAGRVFDSPGDWQAAPHGYVEGCVAIGDHQLPASALLFRAPRSYTRQDMVELHLLGSPVLLAELVEACLKNGARRAGAGEFTARAFLAGAMDLAQASGVAGIIAARSADELHAAQRLLYGSLSRTALAAREQIADLLSLVEGALDFADEPIEFIRPVELRERLTALRDSLTATGVAGMRVERFGRLPTIVLTGPPNVGKSSLLNRLAGQERAICTPIAGTTRDVLSARVLFGAISCTLIDVAGDDQPGSEIEKDAQEASARAVEDADLVLVVREASAEMPGTPQRRCDILVINKIDLIRDRGVGNTVTGGSTCRVSALTGEGLDELARLVEKALSHRTADRRDAAIALMAEHRDAILQAIGAIDSAVALAAACDENLQDADLVAAELRLAAEALGTLVGHEDTEQLLGRIFSRFCVGK